MCAQYPANEFRKLVRALHSHPGKVKTRSIIISKSTSVRGECRILCRRESASERAHTEGAKNAHRVRELTTFYISHTRIRFALGDGHRRKIRRRRCCAPAHIIYCHLYSCMIHHSQPRRRPPRAHSHSHVRRRPPLQCMCALGVLRVSPCAQTRAYH
jgi:hypothetical protein